MTGFIKVLAYCNGIDFPPKELWLNSSHIVAIRESAIRKNGNTEHPFVYIETTNGNSFEADGKADDLHEKILNASAIRDDGDAIRRRFVDVVPGLTSKTWEDIWERVRDHFRKTSA